jgi:hypothetical protein
VAHWQVIGKEVCRCATVVPRFTTAQRGRSKPCVVGFCDIQAWEEVIMDHVDVDKWERTGSNAYINKTDPVRKT